MQDSSEKQAIDKALSDAFQQAQRDNVHYHDGEGAYEDNEATGSSGAMTDVDPDNRENVAHSQKEFAKTVVAGEADIGDQGFYVSTL